MRSHRGGESVPVAAAPFTVGLSHLWISSASSVSDAGPGRRSPNFSAPRRVVSSVPKVSISFAVGTSSARRSEEHTSELQSRLHLVCRLLLEKKKQKNT